MHSCSQSLSPQAWAGEGWEGRWTRCEEEAVIPATTAAFLSGLAGGLALGATSHTVFATFSAFFMDLSSSRVGLVQRRPVFLSTA